MRNYDHLANGAGAREPANNGQDTQAALEFLQMRLDAVTATVTQIERRSQEQQGLPLRQIRDAAILAAVLMISGLLWLTLLGRFF